MEQVGNQDGVKIVGWNRDEDIRGNWWCEVENFKTFKEDWNYVIEIDAVVRYPQGLPEEGEGVTFCSQNRPLASWPRNEKEGVAYNHDVASVRQCLSKWCFSVMESSADTTSLMQRGRGSKRHRSPTPRRRRIPFKARPRNDRSSSRAAWRRAPSRPSTTGTGPSSTASWAPPPWRRHGRGAPRDACAPNLEQEEEYEDVEVVDEAAGPSEGIEPPPTPVFDDGVRAWGELTGILDPMDEPEQLIDPAIVNSSVERMNNMQPHERQRLALDLVRFMALMFAEALRMLSLTNLGVQVRGMLIASSSTRWLGAGAGSAPTRTSRLSKDGKGITQGRNPTRTSGLRTDSTGIIPKLKLMSIGTTGNGDLLMSKMG